LETFWNRPVTPVPTLLYYTNPAIETRNATIAYSMAVAAEQSRRKIETSVFMFRPVVGIAG